MKPYLVMKLNPDYIYLLLILHFSAYLWNFCFISLPSSSIVIFVVLLILPLTLLLSLSHFPLCSVCLSTHYGSNCFRVNKVSLLLTPLNYANWSHHLTWKFNLKILEKIKNRKSKREKKIVFVEMLWISWLFHL